MIVRAHMTSDPVTISPTDTLATAHERMCKGRFRRLPVVEREMLVGMLTDRDLREHHGHLADTRVTGAMVEELVTVSPATALESAAELMLERKIDGLPVVEDGKLVGIITTSDVLRAFLEVTGAAEEGTARLDLVIEDGRFDLSEAARVITARGAEVLGLGIHKEKWDERPVFFIRVRSEDPAKIADVLTEAGFRVLGVHVSMPVDRPSPETSAAS